VRQEPAVPRLPRVLHVRGLASLCHVDHPLVEHKLSLLRERSTSTADFRRVVNELTALLTYEATKEFPTEEVEIETPLERTTVRRISGKKVAVVPVLRAGLGMLDGVLSLVSGARVGFVGLYRDEVTLQPVEYYLKLPADLAERDAIVLDPMLATGNSSARAVAATKEAGARSVTLVCLVAAPEGIAHLQEEHPDIRIYTAAVDRALNERGFIVPGLGDAGDRLYGTK
jgi:uracil phosphoribosyltransferase